MSLIRLEHPGDGIVFPHKFAVPPPLSASSPPLISPSSTMATALETNPHLAPKNEAPGLEMTTALPEEAKTNDAGVPVYMGRFTGTKLITAIT